MKRKNFLVKTAKEVFAIAHKKGHVTLGFVQEIEQLLKNGYGYLTLPSSLDEIVGIAMNQFQPLLQESKEIRDSFSFREKDAWEDDLGLIRRNGGEDDRKHFFHVKPELKSIIDKLLSLHSQGSQQMPQYKKHEQFLRSSYIVYFTVNMFADQVAYIIDLFCESELQQSIKSYSKSSLRLLAYEPYCEVQAAEHTDKSLFTFQLWADVPGLILYDYNREPIHHTHISGKVLTFFGRKMEKRFDHVRHDQIPLAIPHEVSVPSDYKNQPRNSAVFFVHDDTEIKNFQPRLLEVHKPV